LVWFGILKSRDKAIVCNIQASSEPNEALMLSNCVVPMTRRGCALWMFRKYRLQINTSSPDFPFFSLRPVPARLWGCSSPYSSITKWQNLSKSKSRQAVSKSRKNPTKRRAGTRTNIQFVRRDEAQAPPFSDEAEPAEALPNSRRLIHVSSYPLITSDHFACT
jgi:hypothetical protein